MIPHKYVTIVRSLVNGNDMIDELVSREPALILSVVGRFSKHHKLCLFSIGVVAAVSLPAPFILDKKRTL